MANQLRGHEAHRSKYQLTKKALESLLLRQKVLTESVAADSAELAGLPSLIEAARRDHTSELQRVEAENIAALAVELKVLTSKMDAGGASPERESRLHQILSAGRLAKLVPQSYETQKLMIMRIKNPSTGRGFNWSVFNGWLRPPQQAA